MSALRIVASSNGRTDAFSAMTLAPARRHEPAAFARFASFASFAAASRLAASSLAAASNAAETSADRVARSAAIRRVRAAPGRSQSAASPVASTAK